MRRRRALIPGLSSPGSHPRALIPGRIECCGDGAGLGIQTERAGAGRRRPAADVVAPRAGVVLTRAGIAAPRARAGDARRARRRMSARRRAALRTPGGTADVGATRADVVVAAGAGRDARLGAWAGRLL